MTTMKFRIEKLKAGFLSGWAFSEQSKKIAIEIWSNGQKVAASHADLQRPDVAAVFNHAGNSDRSGFAFAFPIPTYDGESVVPILIRFSDNHNELAEVLEHIVLGRSNRNDSFPIDFFNANDALLGLAKAYLQKRGWFDSLNGESRNNEGVVPWITYPAYIQLTKIIRPHFKVFEYGCGNSSLWWARNVAEVVSVDHNPPWYDLILSRKPDNLKLILKEMDATIDPIRAKAIEPFFSACPELPLSDNNSHNIEHGLLSVEFSAYATELLAYPRAYFDVIVVDGMARSLCAWVAAQHVKNDGFILFDNTDRWQYNAGYRFLRDFGFRRIDFCGPGPVNRHEWCTSIFAMNLEAFAVSVDSSRGNSDLGW